MHGRPFRIFMFIATFCAALTMSASGVATVCADTLSLETADGTLTAVLLAEMNVSDPFLFPVWPLQWVGLLQTATGYYLLSDGSRILLSCIDFLE